MSDTHSASTAAQDHRPPTWVEPGWTGITLGVPEQHRPLADAEDQDAIEAAEREVAAATAAFLDHILEPVPSVLPAADDKDGWEPIARAWYRRRTPLLEVWVTDVSQKRRRAVVHAHHGCDKLAKTGSRAWSGPLRSFTRDRLCRSCFTQAPRPLTLVMALDVAANRLRQLAPLRRHPGTSVQLCGGAGRTAVKEAVDNLEDVAHLLAEIHPRVAQVCRAAADATRHTYDTAAAARRSEQVSAHMLTSALPFDVPSELAQRLANEPAVVTLTSAGWSTVDLEGTGAVFDLGKTKSTWDTNAATAVYLMNLASQGRTTRLEVHSESPWLSLALRLADGKVRKLIELIPVADAVLC